MIKTIFICDKCKKQRTRKDSLPEGWNYTWVNGIRVDFCSKKCKPKPKKIKREYVNPNEDTDPGVGSLYGRT